MSELGSLCLAFLAGAFFVLLAFSLKPGGKRIHYQIPPRYQIGGAQFERSMGQLLGPPLIGGNRVEGLRNGYQIFPAMLKAIRAAEETIAFETYIYWSGNIGREFAAALAERSQAGVMVHVLLDWAGSSKLDVDALQRMRDAGVQVEKYRPLRWYNLSRMNNRTHRKLLVVDGKVAFTGGVGIADQWLGDAQSPAHWRDSHFRLEGPAVAQMQAAFMDNWLKTRSEVLDGGGYFPELTPAGNSVAQVFKSSAYDGSECVRLMYLLSISSARQSIRLANAYFVPDDLSVESLVVARSRGVRVEIIVPGSYTDAKIVRKASRSRWGALLEAGVEIYEYQPTMYHCKVMIVDDLWVSVGSTNFDDRSFRLNDEANLNVLDAALASSQTAEFERDKSRSRQIKLAEWKNRPWSQKLAEHVAALFRSQM